MKLVVFGLSISSSWGNGHATLWRGLIGGLARRGCRVTFFERDTSYYAGARDLWEVPSGRLVLYPDWESVRSEARREVGEADVAMVTSFCPDGIAAAELIHELPVGLTVFYDLDTPVTLSALERGEALPYVGPRGLQDFGLVLSYTGGAALDRLQAALGARCVAPLYGHVDPGVHRPVKPVEHYRADLSYLGTYAADRQAALATLLLDVAYRRPEQRYLIGGAQYPADFPWCPNLYFVRHLPPDEHPGFYCSSRLTLNITRAAMAEMGWCPSGRLFEAAACGTPVLSDRWAGLEEFFVPGQEILVARNTGDAVAALDMDETELRRIGRAARERALEDHTSDRRATELLALFDMARRPTRGAVGVEA